MLASIPNKLAQLRDITWAGGNTINRESLVTSRAGVIAWSWGHFDNFEGRSHDDK